MDAKGLIAGNPPLSRHLLNQEDRLVFLHIPKTAGTTLTNVIRTQFDESEICPATHWDEIPGWNNVGRKHISEETNLHRYRFITGHFFYDVGQLLPTQPYFITIFRNPIDRLISLYGHIRARDFHPLHNQVMQMSLKEFAEWDVPNRPHENKNRYAFDLGVKYEHLVNPQDIKRATQLSTDLERTAMERLKSFAFVGLTEKFNESVLLLSYIFGWEPLLNFKSYNRGNHSIVKEDLPDNTMEAIVKNNEVDIRLYQFAQSLFGMQWHQMVEESFRMSDRVDTER